MPPERFYPGSSFLYALEPIDDGLECGLVLAGERFCDGGSIYVPYELCCADKCKGYRGGSWRCRCAARKRRIEALFGNKCDTGIFRVCAYGACDSSVEVCRRKDRRNNMRTQIYIDLTG